MPVVANCYGRRRDTEQRWHLLQVFHCASEAFKSHLIKWNMKRRIYLCCKKKKTTPAVQRITICGKKPVRHSSHYRSATSVYSEARDSVQMKIYNQSQRLHHGFSAFNGQTLQSGLVTNVENTLKALIVLIVD